MMSNHGIHSVSIEEVIIQILVILVFANLDFHKYIWLSHDVYSTLLYILYRTLAIQHTFGYAGFIWHCQAPVVCCELEFANLINQG
jgi:hypothetical protein